VAPTKNRLFSTVTPWTVFIVQEYTNEPATLGLLHLIPFQLQQNLAVLFSEPNKRIYRILNPFIKKVVMSAAQKTPDNITDMHPAAGSRIRVEAITSSDKLPLERVAKLNGSGNFSVDEQRKIMASLQEQTADAKRIRLAYDITAVCGSQQIDGHSNEEFVPVAAIQLSSRNFGYDFALVKTDRGTGLFGKPKHAVQIYRSRLGENNYTYLDMTANTAKALALIDSLYCQAADLHYP
jgi:hypothetical protein